MCAPGLQVHSRGRTEVAGAEQREQGAVCKVGSICSGPWGSGSQCDGSGEEPRGMDVLGKEPGLPLPGGLGPSLLLLNSWVGEER